MAKKVENKKQNLLNLNSETLHRLPMGMRLRVPFNDGSELKMSLNYRFDIFEFYKEGQMVSTHRFSQTLN